MEILTIIPARGGSERIPGKNLVPLHGIPLLAYSVFQAKRSKRVTEVVVSTNDAAIADVARRHGGDVIDRPADLSGPRATSESALLHALDTRRAAGKPEPSLVVFLQCTSPVRLLSDIDGAIELLERDNYDAVFSACRDYGLFWRQTSDALQPINYDPKTRKREQEMGVQWRENGSIFVVKPEFLRRENCRMGGRIGVFEMDAMRSFQIDRPDELALIEWILGLPEYRASRPA